MEYLGKLIHRLDMSRFHFYLHIYGKGMWKTHDIMTGSCTWCLKYSEGYNVTPEGRTGAGWHSGPDVQLFQLSADPTLEQSVWESLVLVQGFPSSLRRAQGGKLPLPVLPLSVLNRWTMVLCAWWQVISLSKQHFTRKESILCISSKIEA